MAGPDDDKKVKDMLDPATRAELERWFRLPSFEQVADRGDTPAEPEDEASAADRKRRADALAAADPALLGGYLSRIEPAQPLIMPLPPLELHVVREIALLDRTMLDRQLTIADPREVQLPQALLDDLSDCTPQALLRDLHRPELVFDKAFEIVDMVARVDAAALVAQAMAPRPPLGAELAAHREANELMRSVRADQRRPWTDLLDQLQNRTVTE